MSDFKGLFAGWRSFHWYLEGLLLPRCTSATALLVPEAFASSEDPRAVMADPEPKSCFVSMIESVPTMSAGSMFAFIPFPGRRCHIVSGKPTRTATKAKVLIATLNHQKFRQPTFEAIAPAMMGPT